MTRPSIALLKILQNLHLWRTSHPRLVFVIERPVEKHSLGPQSSING
jgi:hypothetical protein